MLKGILLSFFMALPIFGELLHYTDTVEIDLLWEEKSVYLDLESGNKTIGEAEKYPLNYPFYSCTSSSQSGDLIIRAITFPVCVCPCNPLVGVGAYQPFYLAKGDISAVDFTKTFNVSNESEFTRIDTVRSYKNREGCYLPFAEYWEWEKPHSFIISTRNGKHALVILDHVNTTVSSDCNVRPEEFTVMGGLRIDWYLQTDGTMDFNGITKVKNTKVSKLSANSQDFKIRFTNQLSGKSGEFYSINGKRIEMIKSRSPYGLVICKEPVIK